MTPAPTTPPPARSLTVALAALVIGAVVGWLGWRQAPEQFFASYLVAWLYWTGLSLGSLALLLLHNLTGGKWGDGIRPLLRSAANLLPLMAALFLPIALNAERIYEWAQPEHVEHDPILQYKQPYLNVGFFQIRAAIYFGLWMALLVMLAFQARSDALPESAASRRFSGQGLGLHGLAVTFASIDWMMSLEPHWFSAIYGVIVFASQGLAALALAIVLATRAARRAPSISPQQIDAFHDLGKLLAGFVLFWAYVEFSQAIIIWYGNLPEEVVWYLRRLNGPWKWVALALIAFHFAVPFVGLLSREWKRHPARLGAIALLIVVMEWVSIVWMVEPAVQRAAKTFFPWIDAGLTAAIGGLWWIGFSLLHPKAIALTAANATKKGRHG